MEKQRTIKELLQVMLDSQHLFRRGLCQWTNDLHYSGLISFSESKVINTYIQTNKPSLFSSFQAFICYGEAYFWFIGDIEPRIKWLKQHINKL